MRVLITGGFGYVGGRLAQFLASKTNYGIILGTRERTEPPHWLPQAQVVQMRFGSPTELARACIGVDAVVHLAGMNAQDCSADPIAALEFNAIATARLLQAACRQGVKRFIYLSTAHVYSNPLAGVITEETCPTSLGPYATSHRAGEDVVRTAHQHGDITGIVMRLSNAYGTPAHKSANCWMLLVNDLCRQAVMTQNMALRSSGLQRRNFIPLTEVCRAISHLLHLPTQDLGQCIFNVGGEWSPTVWELANFVQERCATILGFRPTLTRIRPQVGETSVELDFRSDRLRQSGFAPGSDRTGEIDRLIEFCKFEFPRICEKGNGE